MLEDLTPPAPLPVAGRGELDRTQPVDAVARGQLRPGHAAWLAPTLLTLLGAGLRFYRLADYYSNTDYAYPIAQAIRWLQLGQWPSLGQGTSVAVANPAGMSYLMAVPLALIGGQWGATYFTIALNLLAVPLTYQAGRLAGGGGASGRQVGLAAAALAATNPWVIFFSNATWADGLLPFWTSLTCALLLRALFGRGGAPRPTARAAPLFGALLALAGLTQMYLLALLTLAPVGLTLLLNLRRLAWRALLAGAAVLALALGLYGWQLLRDWPDQAPRVAEFFHSGQTAALSAAAFNHAARFVTGADYEAVYGNDGSADWQARRVVNQAAATVLTAVLCLGLLRAAWRVGAGRRDAGLWLAVLIWWAVPIAALSFPTHLPNIVYLLLSLPAGYLLAAPILAPLAGSRLGLPALAGLGALSFWLIAAGTAPGVAQPASLSLDQLPVSAALRLAPTARAVADAYHVDEFYTGIESASLTAKVGRPLNTVTWVPLPQVEIFPVDRPAVYLRWTAGSAPAPLRLSTTVAQVNYPGPVSVTFDVIRAYSRAELAALPQHALGWPSQQGLTLLGYDLEPGDSSLWVYWMVDRLMPGREQWLYAPFARVTDASGREFARAGAPGLPGYYYRAGDVFLSHITLPPLPSGQYRLDLGMYDGVHGLSLNLLPPGGAPAIDYYRGALAVP